MSLPKGRNMGDGDMDGMLKIAYLVYPEGGIKSHVLTLLSGLDRSRFAPVVICPPGTLADAVERLGIPVHPLEIAPSVHPLHDTRAALRLRKILKQAQPDILHIHGMKAGLVGRLAVQSRRRPAVVLTLHNFFAENLGERQRELIAKIEGFFLRVTDRIIAVSQAVKTEFETEVHLPEGLIEVIYPGMEFRDPVTRSDHPGLRVGTLARLVRSEGIETFIRAAALVLAIHSNVNFALAGEGPLHGNMSALADSLSIRDSIDFVGAQPDVASFLSTLDVFALTPDRAASGLTLLEALSQRMTVVVTGVGTIPEIVTDGEHCLFAEANTPRSVAEKICRLLEDREYAEGLAEAGNRHVRERFTAEKMLQQTQRIYFDVVSKRVQPPKRKLKITLSH